MKTKHLLNRSWSFVQHIYDKTMDLLETLFNTIKYNGAYIMLSITFPLILLYMGVTKDFVVAQREMENYNNIIYISFSFFFLALSIWIIPAFSIRLFLLATKKSKFTLYFYQNFHYLYNGKRTTKTGKQFPVRYLAVLPWCIYIIIIIYCFSGDKKNSVYLLSIIYQITIFLFLRFFIDMYKKYSILFFKKKYRLLCLVLVIIIIPFFTKDMFISGSDSKFMIYLIIYNNISLFLTYTFFVFLENDSQKTSINYKFSFWMHAALIFVNLISLWVLCFMSSKGNLQIISPIVILLTTSIFFILILETFYTVPVTIKHIIEKSKTLQRKGFTGKYTFLRFMFFFVIISFFFVFYYRIKEKDIYTINYKNPDSTLAKMPFFETQEKKNFVDNRCTLTDYFDHWIKINHLDMDNENITNIILISGVGGGSKAGSWFLTNMMYIELMYPQLYQNIFSMSTVSGSSTGANFYMGMKTNELFDDSFKDKNDGQNDVKLKIVESIIGDLYQKNYFSSNLLGLLYSDFVYNPFVSNGENSTIDRNYILQLEERQAMEKAFGISFFNKYKDSFNLKKENEKTYTDNQKKIRDYFRKDYLNLWYQNGKIVDNNSKLVNPLFFINTTMMEKGKKAYFSPIKKENDSRAIDVYHDFFMANKGQSYIPIGTAVVQSEAFPFLCTYNYCQGVGHLGDGGMYENTGTDTTLYIYKKLKKYINDNKTLKERNIRFIFLNFRSGEDSSDINAKKSRKRTMIEYTLNLATNSPFNGHAEDAMFNLTQEIEKNNNRNKGKPRDTLLEFTIPDEFVTTRLISKSTIRKILDYSKKNNQNNFEKLGKLLKPQVQIQTSIAAEKGHQTKQYTVYIQYGDKTSKENAEKIRELINKTETYVAPAIAYIPNFDINQVRYFYDNKNDINAAKEVIDLIHTIPENNNSKNKLEIKYFDYKNFNSKIKEGQLEIWIN